MGNRYAYLGPSGTFSEEALVKNIHVSPENMVALSSAEDVIVAVDKNLVEKGIVPIENSIEGSINVTLDTLTGAKNVFIEREIIHPITQNLVAREDLPLKDIRTIYSLPVPAAQCRKFLNTNLPDADVIFESSTASAVKRLLTSGKHAAAIGSEIAAKMYGLKIISPKINDYKNNMTRFVVIGKERPERTGSDKTSIVCFIANDRPGSLLTILKEFAKRDINLTKIQSRPTKKRLGDYSFWIDVEGHIDDKPVKDVLNVLNKQIRMVKFVGSYPRAKKVFKT